MGHRERRKGVVWGLGLMLGGMVMLLWMYHFIPGDFLHTWWPLIVIAGGFGSLFSASDPNDVGGAVTTIGIGMWMLVATNGWYGLNWSRSWPLALVAAGLGTVARALAAWVWPRGESGHAL